MQTRKSHSHFATPYSSECMFYFRYNDGKIVWFSTKFNFSKCKWMWNVQNDKKKLFWIFLRSSASRWKFFCVSLKIVSPRSSLNWVECWCSKHHLQSFKLKRKEYLWKIVYMEENICPWTSTLCVFTFMMPASNQFFPLTLSLLPFRLTKNWLVFN